MGREALCKATWIGETAEVKALLEATEIILRGGIKARIPRSTMSAMKVEGDCLGVVATDGKLLLDLGEKEALKWLDLLTKPPPSLASKLEIAPEKPVHLIGKVDDVNLLRAVDGATVHLNNATALLAVTTSEAELAAAFELAKAKQLPLWCIYLKGKAARLSDAMIRSFLRAHGMVDNKSCAVSETLTATRYAWPKLAK